MVLIVPGWNFRGGFEGAEAVLDVTGSGFVGVAS